MVAGTVRRKSSADGLRPLNLARDGRQVIALIKEAFGEELDAQARRALSNMRPLPLLAPVIGLLDMFSPPGESMMPGFVWIESRRVVGTASARRIHPYNRGWLISNVAVHPDWQGRGIGRALVEASLDFAQDYGGDWAVLQVRDSNRAARRLYESLGFQQSGTIVHLRKVEKELLPVPTPTRQFRPAGWFDGGALSRLARTLVPHDVLWTDVLDRKLYQTGPWNRMVARLQGRRRQWWVQDRLGYALKAAVGVEIDPHTPCHRLRLLISPQAQDKQLAADLITFGLAKLADAPLLPLEIEHPASDTVAQSALVEAGFEQAFALIHLRLDMK